MGELTSRGRDFEPYWFRTSDQQELDLVLEMDGERWAVEVKLTASPGPEDMARLDRYADLLGADRRFLVSRTPRPAGDERRASLDLDGFLELLGGS